MQKHQNCITWLWSHSIYYNQEQLKNTRLLLEILGSSGLECQELSTRNILVFLHNKEFLSRRTIYWIWSFANSLELGFMRPSIKFVTHFRCSPEKCFLENWSPWDNSLFNIYQAVFFVHARVPILLFVFLDYFMHLNQVFWQWSLWPCGELSSTGVCCCCSVQSDRPSRTCATTPPQNKVLKAIYIRLFWLVSAADSPHINHHNKLWKGLLFSCVCYSCTVLMPFPPHLTMLTDQHWSVILTWYIVSCKLG